jgi:hypothetical protein
MSKHKKIKGRGRGIPPYLVRLICDDISNNIHSVSSASYHYKVSRESIYTFLRKNNIDFVKYKTHMNNQWAKNKKKAK